MVHLFSKVLCLIAILIVCAQPFALHAQDNAEVPERLIVEHLGPYGGAIKRVTFHYTEAEWAYLLSRRNRLYISQDAGNSWKLISINLPEGLGVTAFDMSPSDPKVLLVAGTVDGSNITEVYYSKDAGETWEARGTIIDNAAMGIFLDDDNHDQFAVVSAHPGEVLYTRNKGKLFESKQDAKGGFYAAYRSPVDPKVWFLGSSASSSKYAIFKSEDSGKSWQGLTKAMPHKSGGLATQWISQDPKNPKVLYAMTYGMGYQSVDGGKKWKLIWENTNGQENNAIESIQVSPQNTSVVVATSWKQIMVSTRKGSNFKQMLPERGKLAMAPGKKPRAIFFPHLGGYKVGARLPGRLRDAVPTGFSSTIIGGVFVLKGSDKTTLMASHNGIMTSQDMGKTWKQVVNERRARGRFFHDDDRSVIYMVGARDAWRSSNDGRTWRKIDLLLGRQDMVQGAYLGNDGRLYVTSNQMFFYLDEKGKRRPSQEAKLGAIIQDSKGDLIAVRDRKELVRSTDMGKNWQKITELRFTPNVILEDKHNEGSYWIGTNFGVYHVKNGKVSEVNAGLLGLGEPAEPGKNRPKRETGIRVKRYTVSGLLNYKDTLVLTCRTGIYTLGPKKKKWNRVDVKGTYGYPILDAEIVQDGETHHLILATDGAGVLSVPLP